MKFLQKNSIWLILALVLQACALLDIAPKVGFPDPISTTKASPHLLPSDAYDFHGAPRL